MQLGGSQPSSTDVRQWLRLASGIVMRPPFWRGGIMQAIGADGESSVEQTLQEAAAVCVRTHWHSSMERGQTARCNCEMLHERESGRTW